MQRLRYHIHNYSFAWACFLALALVFALGMNLHIHVHSDHLYSSNVDQHTFQTDHHDVHLGNTHDAEHASNQHHNDIDTKAIDISPEGLYKNISITPLAIALISTIILLLSPSVQARPIRRHRNDLPPVQGGHNTLPQLRAPPLKATI